MPVASGAILENLPFQPSRHQDSSTVPTYSDLLMALSLWRGRSRRIEIEL